MYEQYSKVGLKSTMKLSTDNRQLNIEISLQPGVKMLILYLKTSHLNRARKRQERKSTGQSFKNPGRRHNTHHNDINKIIILQINLHAFDWLNRSL